MRGGMSVGHWKERNTCVGDEDSADCGKEGRKEGGLKNRGTSMVRSGMSAETTEGNGYASEEGWVWEKRNVDKGGRKERTRGEKTSLTCQCTAFPPGVPRPAGPLAPC